MNNNQRTEAVRQRFLQMPDEQLVDALIELLGSTNATEVAFARYIATGIGPPATSTLFHAAIQHRRRSRQCANLLDVVGEIGAPLDAADWFSLLTLLRHNNIQVRLAASRLMIRLRQVGRGAPQALSKTGITPGDEQ